MARKWRVPLTMVCAASVVACGGEQSLRCMDESFYTASASAPPLQVPDDLSVPDESEALQIPPGETPPDSGEDAPPNCLEQPPDFFDTDTPN